jgi:hypothetical protein
MMNHLQTSDVEEAEEDDRKNSCYVSLSLSRSGFSLFFSKLFLYMICFQSIFYPLMFVFFIIYEHHK